MPCSALPLEATVTGAALQRRRRLLQAGFFALFLLAPALNLLRFDLHEAQLWVLGQRWTLGIAAFQRGEITANEVALSIFLLLVPAWGEFKNMLRRREAGAHLAR